MKVEIGGALAARDGVQDLITELELCAMSQGLHLSSVTVTRAEMESMMVDGRKVRKICGVPIVEEKS